MSVLAVTGLSVAYGPIRAVRGLDLTVEEGELVALLGPNGAGKTSTMSALMGMVPPERGTIRLRGKNITGWGPERVVRVGMTLVPEGRRVFAGLTVEENLRLGAAISKEDRWSSRIAEVFPVLVERKHQQAGTLSGGEQQQLAIARALLSNPTVLLLDEPSLGLAPSVVDRIFHLIGLLKQQGLTILLVEQNVDRSMHICDRAILLVSGEKEAEGTPQQLSAQDAVHEAFFGAKAPT